MGRLIKPPIEKGQMYADDNGDDLKIIYIHSIYDGRTCGGNKVNINDVRTLSGLSSSPSADYYYIMFYDYHEKRSRPYISSDCEHTRPNMLKAIGNLKLIRNNDEKEEYKRIIAEGYNNFIYNMVV